ncbi:MAG: DNA recombination protein RmuC [Sedimentisphaerales bacterium]|nr:DNA recombination protein RmuC [Sedimentisphaerales bacterium]
MADWVIITLIVCGTVLAGVIVVQFLRLRQGANLGRDQLLQSLQQQVSAISAQQETRLDNLTRQLTTTLTDVSKSVNDQLTASRQLDQQTQQNIGQRLDAAGQTIGQLKTQLGQLGQATQHITEVGQEVRKLQDILRSPKLRGALGEWTLENLLAEVLPKEHYRLQHRFANGTIVDALVMLAQGKVAIDAKFPLENFQKMRQAPNSQVKRKCRQAFLQDICGRIDEISDRYILPTEGTLDFALMFIPAENVYYEALIRTEKDRDIAAYGRAKKVIPVSPNTLYAYLMVISMGLKGLKIEQNAQAIRQQLTQLDHELNAFNDEFSLLGKHLHNAAAKHHDAAKKLDHFQLRLQQLDNDSLTPPHNLSDPGELPQIEPSHANH